MDNRSISHTRWKCQYHIVFIPKYRKKVLYGKIRDDVREIISTFCKYKDVEIITGAVCIDCQTAHCGRCKLHFDFGENASPIVPYRYIPQIAVALFERQL